MASEPLRLRVTREIQIDVGHRLPFHNAACCNVHGHRYRIVAEVEGPVVASHRASDNAMVADFAVLKEVLMREVHDPLDHAFMVWEEDQPLRGFLESQGWRLVVMNDPPTAEALATWCYRRVQAALSQRNAALSLKRLTVWETPNCSAVCEA
ncbi:MAG: 6-carboxytetrahydropterin synthase [Candidatus Sumerlaeia bacterium]|nr:6-carboxytetrahydropterin synthase [Candidatus Sumerlaeia bacterium]